MGKHHKNGPKIEFTVSIGRGQESKDILMALKSKAKASGKFLSDFVLESCFHQCLNNVVKSKPLPIFPSPTEMAKAFKPQQLSRSIDYSSAEEPPPPQIDLAGLPSSKPLAS